MKPTRVFKTIEVFSHWNASRTPDLGSISLAAAMRLKSDGKAKFINRNKAIRLETPLQPDPGWDSTKVFSAGGLSASGQLTEPYLAAVGSRRRPEVISEGAIAAAESWAGPMKSGGELSRAACLARGAARRIVT